MLVKQEIIHLFWTGGLDSTFRLIQLLRTTKNIVQPHYLIRYEDSTGVEMHVMLLIRKAINEKYPNVQERFLPTRYTNAALIKTFEDVEEQVKELGQFLKINEQDRLMANYCRENNIDRIEVSFDSFPDETPEDWLDARFKKASVFKSFIYPVLHLSKKDMWGIGKVNEWIDRYT